MPGLCGIRVRTQDIRRAEGGVQCWNIGLTDVNTVPGHLLVILDALQIVPSVEATTAGPWSGEKEPARPRVDIVRRVQIEIHQCSGPTGWKLFEQDSAGQVPQVRIQEKQLDNMNQLKSQRRATMEWLDAWQTIYVFMGVSSQ